MKYGSVCSGVEAATVAWHSLGWEPQWFSEIEKFPSAVLAHHYPDTPNYGDMTAFKEWPNDRSNGVELIVGGPPCQDFSIAGQRRGMSVAGNEGGERANLTLKYLDLVAHFRPRWICYENVPGLLSSNKGRDFGAFLGALAELGYGFSWRTLDAQFYGVPQRRRRVFVVGHIGDWRRAAAVLFERESLSGHPAPSRKARQETAGTIAACSFSGGAGGRPDGAAVNNFVPIGNVQDGSVATLSSREYKGLSCGRDGMTSAAVVFTTSSHGAYKDGVGTLRAHGGDNGGGSENLAVAQASAVRRLTPVECERLQGFPDDYTQIPWRNKPAENCPDGPRYKAMGNSMAVPVMRWIGERINMADAL